MCGVFRDEGVHIDKVYFCPFHAEHGVGRYKIDSPLRKPRPGMILQAASEFDIDLRNSVLLGDRESDIQAGTAAGIECRLLFDPSMTLSPSAANTFRRIRNFSEAESILVERANPEPGEQHRSGAGT
jgi:histidinol phosphatase-like enzyme